MSDRLNRVLLAPWLLAFALALSFFSGLASYPLYDIDEGAFSEATREMFENGNFISTYLNGEPRHDKPILIYWFQAATVAVFGLNEFALRLPSALAATAWALALFGFVRRWFDRDSAAVAVLVMANALVVSVIARAATADALLNLWLVLTFFEIYHYSRAPSRAVALRAYLWMALGVLTKGPVAIFFPVIVSAIHFGWERRWREWFGVVFYAPGWLLFLAVALPWHIAVYLDQGTAFFEGFLLDHNLGRYSDTMEGHGGSLLYYVAILPLSLLPFSGWLVRIVPGLRAGLADPARRLLWIWFLVVFVFFSLSNTQLPHYLLYGGTPLFILMALERERLASRWLAYLPPLALLAALIALPELFAALAGAQDRAYDRMLFEAGAEAFGTGDRLLFAAALVVLLLGWRRAVRPWQGLVVAGLLQTALLSWAVAPKVLDVLQGGVREAGLTAKALALPTVRFDTNFPSFSVYREAVTRSGVPRPGELALVRADKWEKLVKALGGVAPEVVLRRHAILLVRVPERDGPD